jgi:hypothetical protein
MTAHKDRLAHANAYLIDDFDVNVERFCSRGGNGILFPQLWNSNHAFAEHQLDYVIKEIMS